jgi:hypothetical protein
MTTIGDLPPAYRKLYTLMQSAELYVMGVLRESRRPPQNADRRAALTVAYRLGFLAALARVADDDEVAELMLKVDLTLDPKQGEK